MKLNVKRTTLIGLAFMSILAFWQFYDQVIPYLLEYHFHLKTITANAIMSIDNVLALFMLPLFGTLSDKTHTKLGKRTPYILGGTIAASALMLALAHMTEKGSFLGFFLVLVALLVVMSTYRSPSVAYMPDVTPKPLRSKGNAVINLVGYVGGIGTTVMMMLLLKSEKAEDGSSIYQSGQSFLPIFLAVIAFLLIPVLIMVLTVHENKVNAEMKPYVTDEALETEERKNGGKLPAPLKKSLFFLLLSTFLWFAAYNSVTTAFSRYCVKVLNVDLSQSSGYLLTATVVAIIAFVPLGWLTSRVGRKRTILCGIVLMTLCYFAIQMLGKPSIFLNIIFALIGIGWAAINVNSYPMVVEMSTSGDIGRYTGYYYSFSMAAQVVTPLLSGVFITWLGYKALFPYAVIFSALALVTMSFVKHGDSRPDQKSAMLEGMSGGDD